MMTPVRLDDPPRNFREVSLILHQIVLDVSEIKDEVQKLKDVRETESRAKLNMVAGALITFTSGVVTPLVVWAITR